jgi:hypothetical protein
VTNATKQVEQIEAAQQALRKSIDATKELAEKTEALLQKHKKTLAKEQPDS